MLKACCPQLKKTYSSYIGDDNLKYFLNEYHAHITTIQAKDRELVRCCEILDRPLPKSHAYTFLGVNAQEIAVNWY